MSKFESSNSNGQIRKRNLWFLVSVLAIIGLWFANLVFNYFYEFQSSDPNATAGQFGDKFGAVNALFSGLAFIGIIYTLQQQKSDLRQQNRNTSIERFESTFFNLLNAMSQNIPLIKLDPGLHAIINPAAESSPALARNRAYTFNLDAPIIGHDVFINLIGHFHNLKIKFSLRDVDSFKLLQAYYKHQFHFYYNNVFSLLEYIDSAHNVLTDQEKLFYVQIVRNQITNQELQLMICHCLTDDKPARKKIVEKFSFFSDFLQSGSMDLDTVTSYDPVAFGLSQGEFIRLKDLAFFVTK